MSNRALISEDGFKQGRTLEATGMVFSVGPVALIPRPTIGDTAMPDVRLGPGAEYVQVRFVNGSGRFRTK